MFDSSPRVALARTEPSYENVLAPFDPDFEAPELRTLYGEAFRIGGRNPTYRAVRASLQALGLDEDRIGQPEWNPLGSLVRRGGRVVLKPNLIRHYNPCPDGSLQSVVTHGSILRAVADYAWLAVGGEGSVVIAEAPQQDCEWKAVAAYAGLGDLVTHYAALGLALEIVDIRREEVTLVDGIIINRRSLPGDPAGYRVVDLGSDSFFGDSNLDPVRFRGADYDPGPTAAHHSNGLNEYLLSETVLSADLVVNLPKLKTHKKTGVTLALKNLVGINGDKNWLPHHTLGNPSEGGDEYPGEDAMDRVRSRATEVARMFLDRGLGRSIFRLVRRFEDRVRGSEFIRSGNWYGNMTTWRMCLDLNICLYYSDDKGFYADAKTPRRRVLTLLDGIVAGEEGGPLAPRDVPLGAMIASEDPVAVDLVALKLMDFDHDRVPKIHEAMRAEKLRVTRLRSPSELELVEVDATQVDAVPRLGVLGQLDWGRPFRAHSGWTGHLENER